MLWLPLPKRENLRESAAGDGSSYCLLFPLA